MADDSDDYRRRAERFLRQASTTSNMAERGRLIDEALHWHNLAMDSREHQDDQINDNADGEDGESLEASGG
ncbi:MAG: hypothetical protein JWP86_1147 [Phenylobacterium sp.]|nr:hypothetical protein [Phenylobacterium sp.]